MRHNIACYKLVVSTFEKYGFTAIPCADLSKLIIVSHQVGIQSVTAKDIRLIIEYEGLSDYVTDFIPRHQAGYMIYLL